MSNNLKRAIRDRMERTGETYSTARMNILADVNDQTSPTPKDKQKSLPSLRAAIDQQCRDRTTPRPSEPQMFLAEAIKPADLFNLSERARFTLNGECYVAYDDGQLMDVITASGFDCPTVLGNYSHWCSSTTTAPRAAYLFAGKLLDLEVFHSGAEGAVRQPEAE